jgi:beta-lactamase superfamily II metal-dependent hydrolase
VNYLDMLVVTNYDQDHISGFPNLNDQIVIGNLLRNTSVATDEIGMLKSEDGIVSYAMDEFLNAVDNNFGSPGQSAPLHFPLVEWSAFNNSYPIFDDENNLSLVLVLKINGIQFIFPGDMETAGWRYLLETNQNFANLVSDTHVLIASHHGRENGICTELFDEYGCSPEIIIISDDYRQYNTQYTTGYYGTKCNGITGFRNQELRKVLTTRRDGYIRFEFVNNGCIVV